MQGLERDARPSSAVDPVEPAHVSTEHESLDAGAEGLEVRHPKMRLERGLVLVDLVQDDAVGLLPIERDVELVAARLAATDWLASVLASSRNCSSLSGLTSNSAMITNAPLGAVEPAMAYLPGE